MGEFSGRKASLWPSKAVCLRQHLCVAVGDGRPFRVDVLLGQLFHNLTWEVRLTQGLNVSGLRAFVPQ